MKNILFVCTGNTCRSPMAEGFLKAGLQRDEKLSCNFSVSSAGIYAYEGECASSNSISIMHDDWDIDISSHVTKSLNKEIVDNAFLILTMTRQQKEAILSKYPYVDGKLFTLKEFAGGKQTSQDFEQYDYTLDITDPFGMPSHIYSICADEIREAVEKLLNKLVNT